jgi:hypothetical protein
VANRGGKSRMDAGMVGWCRMHVGKRMWDREVLRCWSAVSLAS